MTEFFCNVEGFLEIFVAETFVNDNLDKIEVSLLAFGQDIVELTENGLYDVDILQYNFSKNLSRAAYCRSIRKSGGVYSWEGKALL